MTAEDLLILSFYAGTFLSALMVVAGAWLTPDKRLPAWLMAVGSVLFLPTFGGVFWVHYDFSDYSYASIRWVEQVGMGGMGLSVLLFAMGFFMDRLQRRQREKAEEERLAVGEPGGA